MTSSLTDLKPESWLVTAGRASEPGAPLNVPLVPASNFIIGRGREYARDDGTPTWEALEDVVGGLEAGRAVAFASGMAAIAAVFDQLPAGSAVVLPDDCYQGVAGLVAAGAERGRWSVRRVACISATSRKPCEVTSTSLTSSGGRFGKLRFMITPSPQRTSSRR